MKDFEVDWSKVAPEYRPEKLYGVVEFDGNIVEFTGYRRHWWPLGENMPRIDEPRFCEIWAEFNNIKLVSHGKSLTEAKVRLVRQYKHRSMFEDFKANHPDLKGKSLMDAFWVSKEYKQFAKDFDGDSGETAKIS